MGMGWMHAICAREILVREQGVFELEECRISDDGDFHDVSNATGVIVKGR